MTKCTGRGTYIYIYGCMYTVHHNYVYMHASATQAHCTPNEVCAQGTLDTSGL